MKSLQPAIEVLILEPCIFKKVIHPQENGTRTQVLFVVETNFITRPTSTMSSQSPSITFWRESNNKIIIFVFPPQALFQIK